ERGALGWFAYDHHHYWDDDPCPRSSPISGPHYAGISHVGIQHYPRLTYEYWSDALFIDEQPPQTSPSTTGLVAPSSPAGKYTMWSSGPAPQKLCTEGRWWIIFLRRVCRVTTLGGGVM